MQYPWNIIGHRQQLNELEHDIKTHSLGHAYLLSGSGHLGKFTIAKSLACVLACPNNLCRTCPTCAQIKNGSHIDTIEINDDGESVKIEQIRDIIARLHMTCQSDHKILLVKNIERLTPEAGNCLLKTLEEPPDKTIFIFTTSDPKEVLETIQSRMRILKFTPVPEKILFESLQKDFPDVESQLMEEIILLSMGKPGRAIQLITDGESLAFFRELYQTVRNTCSNESMAEGFLTAASVSKESAVCREFLDMLVHYVRGQLLKNPGESAGRISILEAIQESKALLKKNVNSKLLLENLILKLGNR